jgi:predicted transcriptional regulator
MSERKAATVKPERFFVQASPEVRKALQHLAIDMDMSAEKLGGMLLRDAVSRKQAELDAQKKPAKR